MLNKFVTNIYLAWKPQWTPQRLPLLPPHVRQSSRVYLLSPEFWHCWLARYPQTWLWLWSGLAWIVLINRVLERSGMPDICSSSGLPSGQQFINMVVDWGLMIVAMMFPLLNEQIRHVASRMPANMRNAAIHWFLLAYTLQWLCTGLFIYGVSFSTFSSLTAVTNKIAGQTTWGNILPALSFALAAAWVCSPMRRNAQLACSRTIPMRIQGWRAWCDSLHYGVLSGSFCIRNCWAPMLALILAQHGLFLMILVASLLTYERYFLNYKSRALALAWTSMALAFLLQSIFRI
ncbi:DUF2182 domain-containing protein [Undibacterium sp. TS12]|uniref:copper chaperone n=1 Tax=Undibacterium sp. TS12 TaxID=2908202 RepID=UPI001F4C789C|nr:DUF2182 domain-containing protein [Undibacterium sp. TS12]MCH8619012.1 DUF2182 domain-containing protein [Undibacterium sp. TS12]